MDKEEENRYVSQLQDVFNSCDTTGTGYLDKEELTDLCHKLHLEEQLSLLLQTLLGSDHFARVNFDEFKEGFVAVLSSTIDISISEDESSYLEPVIPDEVKPKFVKGHKRYGRRTQPELEAAENETNKFLQEQHHHVKSKRKSQLKRSSSLESVESLKSDEEAECAKEPQDENFEAQGQLRTWNSDIFDSPRRNSSPCSDMTEHQVRDIWEELGIGHNGYLNQQELATVCKNIGLKDLSKEELEDLFHKLDRDGDGRVSFEEFQVGLFCHAPLPISSTPLKQRRPRSLSQHLEDSSRRTTTPSLVSACGGLHLFSSVDDGSGFVTPEQIMAIWEEEGIENGKDILMSLDFSLEEQVNLVEFTTALDNELIATKNRIHLAALASYKHELHHRHGQIDQITKERDKVKLDLERAEKRTLELANEVDDHNSVMESLNESKIKDMEQDYRHKVLVIRSELESEREQIMQQTDQHATKLEADLHNLQVEESFLKEKLNVSVKENGRLQKEMVEIVGKLYESESQVLKLQMDVDKRPTDPQHSELFNQEEKFAEIINEYEAQCRDLRDRNDELQIQLETMRSQLNESKYTRLLAKMKDNKALHLKAKEKIHHNHLTNDAHAKKAMYTKRRSLSSAGANGLGAVESESSPMNMDAELTKHQLKEQQQEVQDLRIQLETKVNYYEREIELMKANFEEERKDTEQRFKMEVSEVEDQKADLEELNAKYQEVIDGLKEQLPTSAHYQELEKRFEKERAKMEQSHAKEMASLRQRLTSDNEQLEEELKRSHQNELQAMRMELSRLSEDNRLLRSKLERFQQEVSDIQDINKRQRKQVEDLKMEKVKAVSDLELLNKQIQKHRDEMCQLNAQSLQLSGTVSDVSAQNVGYQDSIQQLTSRLEEVTQQKGEEAAAAEQLQEMLNALEREKLQQQSVWQREREQLGHELQMSKEEIQQHRYELCQLNAQSLQLSGTVSDLSAQNVRCQETIQQLTSRLKEVTQQKEEEAAAVEPLQEMLNALEREKLQQHSVWQREREQLGHELQMSKEEIQKHRDELCQLNAQSLQLSGTVSDVSAQNVGYQDSIRQLTSRLKAVTQQKGEEAAAAEQLQEMLNALEREKLQQQSVWQREREQLGHELQMSKEEVESLILQHQREKEEQLRELNESNNQVFIMEALQEQVAALKREKQSLEDEGQSITKQLEETADQIHELESDLKQTHEECQTLRRNQVQLREELEESQDQLLEANTKLTLAQSQHMREVQHLKEKLGSAVSKEQLSPLQNRLLEEQHKVQQLQEKLRFHAEQTNRQLAMQQEEHVKLLRRIEERMEDVEMNLKNVRVMLQEKVNQLKEQLEKNAKSDLLLKDLYVENSQLMKALQVTEQRQKSAEKKNYVLEDKIAALNKVIRKIAPASLAV
ncbi:ninein-like protein isoform X10 [Ascaphus truei]|uniref:ninein-like protein isoform X10 n=1 Tax=Ascaphus truei TaxID=8439 RepID=UPI003F599642